MSSRVRKLLDEALALPPEDRALLAAELEAADDASAEEIAEAWDEEVLARIRKVERGEAKTSDWDDVYRRLRAKHGGG
jgi:hypothetical protein